MSTIYDRLKSKESQTLVKTEQTAEQPLAIKAVELPAKELNSETPLMDIDSRIAGVSSALCLVDDVVLKKYLTQLSTMPVVPLAGDWSVKKALEDVIVFKVNKMIYEKDEYATEKFNSIISAMTYTNGSVFMIVDGYEDRTDFYLGVKLDSKSATVSSYADTLQRALIGQFPGAKINDLSTREAAQEFTSQEILIKRMQEDADTISICSGIPALKNCKGEYTNATFIQGIEKFAAAMSGKRYTAIILATNVPDNGIGMLRNGYENVYTQLSAAATHQLAYSTNESLANAISRSKGVTDSSSITDTVGKTTTKSQSTIHTEQKSETHTEGESKENFWGKAAKFADPLLEAGALLTATGVGTPIGAVMMGAGAVAGIGGAVGAKQTNKSDATTKGTADSIQEGTSESMNQSQAKSKTHSESITETNGKTATIGSSKSFTLTVQDKHIQEIQKRIEKQLERMADSESTGLWATCAYFFSYKLDRATAETGAAIYRSIVQGEQSGVEQSSISTWYKDSADFENLKKYICGLSHPVFSYKKNGMASPTLLPPTNMLSSKEVAIALALPRKSVPGFPVVEHISLGKEIVRLEHKEDKGASFDLGCIFDQGVERTKNRVLLDTKSLSQHTFVTGSTGCGKSETVYKLIDGIRNAGAKFLIIEPAKGEYKNVFGTEHIFGTNPLISNLLKINPFKFTEGVHVLEHADRLIEIFNACWPMYAAMPAVLKEAVLNAYEDCGWDLVKSTNKYSGPIFPTFSDLIWELEAAIEMSEYSEEVKSNYKGSLVTRVKSLANGINGEIFSGQEIGDNILFDENVIVDISRIGSQETKALIMGILIMRLNEYRVSSELKANSGLRHVTIIEEAHNLLKRCSQEQSSEGSNVSGKAVEMISNSIAEMRTYGEGFIIVDQSPGAVDISAIRNTNTKIIMRLPEDSDRKVAGKSAAMKECQIDEIAKLPTGVAVVYQNDWEEPVLCKVEQFEGERLKYEFKEDVEEAINLDALIVEVIKFMFQTKVAHPMEADLDNIKNNISKSVLPTYVKINILDAIHEFNSQGKASIWSDDEFIKFSWVISGLLGLKQHITKLAKQPSDFDELTKGIKDLIHNRVKGLPEDFDMAIIQSLLRDYSVGDDSRIRRYSDWLKTARERLE